MDANKQFVSLIARLEVVLWLVAFTSFVFAIGDVIAGVFAFINDNDVAISFSYVWAGCVFAIINGSLDLRAVCNKPRVNHHWAKVCFGFGIATLIMHCIDLGLAVTGLAIYGASFRLYFNYWYYLPVTYSAALPEVARLVMLTCLVALDSLQIHFAKTFMYHPLSKDPNAAGSQTAQFVQTLQPGQMAPTATAVQMPMQVQMQMPMQTGMTAFTNQAGQVFFVSPVATNNVGFSATVLPGSAVPMMVNAGASSSNAAQQGQYSQQMPPAYQDKF